MSELRILDHKIHNVNDKVYFLMNSIDDPTGFIICYGEIQSKNSANLNIVYLIKLLKIFETKESMIQNFHMKRFRVLNNSSKQFKQLTINLIDILDEIDFNEKLQLKTDKYSFTVQSFFINHDLEKVKELKERASEISKDYLNTLMKKFI